MLDADTRIRSAQPVREWCDRPSFAEAVAAAGLKDTTSESTSPKFANHFVDSRLIQKALALALECGWAWQPANRFSAARE